MEGVPYVKISELFGCSVGFLTKLKKDRAIVSKSDSRGNGKVKVEDSRSLEEKLLDKVTDSSSVANDEVAELVIRDQQRKAQVDETLDHLIEGLGNSAELRYKVAFMSLKSAQNAITLRPDDADIANKVAQVLKTCTPILEQAERHREADIEKVLELWNS